MTTAGVGVGVGSGNVPTNSTPAGNTLDVCHRSHGMEVTSGVASNTQIAPDKETVGSYSEDMLSSKGHSALFFGFTSRKFLTASLGWKNSFSGPATF